ncbi:hypothetical protein [Rhodococcus sp. M8-35]
MVGSGGRIASGRDDLGGLEIAIAADVDMLPASDLTALDEAGSKFDIGAR